MYCSKVLPTCKQLVPTQIVRGLALGTMVQSCRCFDCVPSEGSRGNPCGELWIQISCAHTLLMWWAVLIALPWYIYPSNSWNIWQYTVARFLPYVICNGDHSRSIVRRANVCASSAGCSTVLVFKIIWSGKGEREGANVYYTQKKEKCSLVFKDCHCFHGNSPVAENAVYKVCTDCCFLFLFVLSL